MRIEEANRFKDKLDSLSLNFSKANLVESAVSTHRDRFKSKDKKNQKLNHPRQQNKFGNKIQKPKGLCYVCGNPGHKAYQCTHCKGQSQPNQKPATPIAQANLAKDIEIIYTVVKEANLVANSVEWVHNTGASRHFCSNKEPMQEFKDVTYGECIYMGNSMTARVMGEEKILVKFSSGKLLSLSNMLYMPSLRRNLVSSVFFNKVGLKTFIGDDKVVISYNEVFVGKWYLNESLFILNLASETMNGNASSSDYIAESVDLGMVG